MICHTIAAAAAGMPVNNTEAHALCCLENEIVVWPAAGPQACAAYHQGPNKQLASTLTAVRRQEASLQAMIV